MKRRTACLLVALAAVSAACTTDTVVSSSPPEIHPTTGSFGNGGTTWHLVALGDSVSQGAECPGCMPFVDLYAMALARRAGVKVDRANWSVRGFTSGRLLDLVRRNAGLRSDLSAADVVTITIGVNDLPWNAGADRCEATATPGSVNWAEITPACLRTTTARYAELLGELLDQVAALRGGRPTMVRLTGFYDEWIGRPGVGASEQAIVARGIRMFDWAQQRVAAAHDARVADLLHVLNGPGGTRDAGAYLEPGHTVHPNQRGHGVIAEVLLRLGLAPLQP